MKKYLFGSALLVLFSLFLFSETALEKIEAQLPGLQGKKKITRLLELTWGFIRENPQKAVKYGNDALRLLNSFPDKKVRAAVLKNMSIAYSYLQDYQNAREYARASFKIAEEIDDKTGMANALDSLGMVSLDLEEFEKARGYFSRSAELHKKLNNQTNLAHAYNLLAQSHWKLSNYAKAMGFLFQSLKIHKELGNQVNIAGIYGNLGILYRQLKKTDKSLEYYRKALQIKEEINYKKGMATTLNNMGLIYQNKSMYQKALEYFEKALKISEEFGRQSLTSTILLNIGDIYKRMKNDQLALKYLNRGLKMKEELDEKEGIARALIFKASVNLRLGQYDKAIKQAGQGLDYAQKINVKPEIREAYRVLSESYEALGDLGKALDYHKKFKEKSDEIIDESTAWEMAGLETNFEIERSQKKIELLRKDQEIQKTILSFLVLFALLVLLLAFVLYTRYRLKARVTRALEREIAERKQTEEKFRVLAEKSVVGIWIIQDHIIKYANPMSLKIFGYSPGEMIDKNPLELVAEEDRPIMSEQLARRMSGNNNTLSYQFKGLTKEGEILHLESYGSLTHYQGQPAVLESVIDITRRKKTESELIKSRKMESVGILAGGIAHDFNNLLAIIVGNTSMLRLSFSDQDPRIGSFLENVEKASAQAADLAQKFITFSQGGWLMRKKLTLANILKEAAQLSPEINQIPCEISIDPDLEPIYGDERQIRQVITNLLLNAHEATSDNSKKITIKGKNIVLEKGNPFSLKEGKYVQISVIDNGRGIPAELLEKIFDPYFSTKDTVSQKGLGMGLALCYSIAKKHEGHIAISSEVQKGTTVDLYLPVYDDQ